jgi:hypothetical protein
MKRKGLLLSAGVAIAFASAAGFAQDLELKKMPPSQPKVMRLMCTLAPEFGMDAKGWMRMEAKQFGGEYYVTAQLTVYTKDFKQLNIDANNGFGDEAVIVKVKDQEYKLVLAYVELTGPVFTAYEVGFGPLPANRGDVVTVAVNGVLAATGKF